MTQPGKRYQGRGHRTRRAAVFASCTAVVLFCLPTDSAWSLSGPTSTPSGTLVGELLHGSGGTLLESAAAAGERVEDLAQRTETTQVFANPDGTWTSETSTTPTRVKLEDGSWEDVDLDLEAVDGRLQPKAAGFDLTLSAGGDSALATLTNGGQEVDWGWATSLPEPDVHGASATYSGAVPTGGDLVVTATPTGFEHHIILNSPPPEGFAVSMPVATDDGAIVESPAGGVRISDQDGQTVSTAAPVMWDSQISAISGPENTSPVGVSAVSDQDGVGVVTLEPDEGFLQDPSTDYPVTIDPSYTTAVTGDTYVQSNVGANQGSSAELHVGTPDGGVTKARTYLKFADDPWDHQVIQSASLSLSNYYSPSCTAAAIVASRVTENLPLTGLSWANQPSVTTADNAAFMPAYGASGCPTANSIFDVTGMVTKWAAHTAPNYGIRLAANSEANSDSWRRYRASEFLGSTYPKISVTYSVPPGAPAPPVVTPGGTGYITTLNPTLSATVSDPDGGTVRGDFYVYQGDELVWSGSSVNVASGSVARAYLTDDSLNIGESYTVRVRAFDGQQASVQSNPTSFQVDAYVARTATACASPCIAVSPGIQLASDVGGDSFASNERREFAVNVPGVDADSMDRVNVQVSATGSTSGGSLTIFNPSFSVPVPSSLTYAEGSASTVSAEITLSAAGTIAVVNNGQGNVTVSATVSGYFPWYDQDTDYDPADTDELAEDENLTQEVLEEEAGLPAEDQFELTGPPSEEQQVDAGSTAPVMDGTNDCSPVSEGEQICVTPASEEAPSEALRRQSATFPIYANSSASRLPSCDNGFRKWSLQSRQKACLISDYHVNKFEVEDGVKTLVGTHYIWAYTQIEANERNGTALFRRQFEWKSGGGTPDYMDVASNTYCSGCSSLQNAGTGSMYGLSRQQTITPIEVSTAVRGLAPNQDASFYMWMETTLVYGYPVGRHWRYASKTAPRVRCDRKSYIKGTGSAGCVIPSFTPTWKVSRSITKIARSAAHIASAQSHLGGHPGREVDGTPLTRNFFGKLGRNLNRREARRECRSRYGPQPSGDDCDEYPFSSSNQGCGQRSCSVEYIPFGDNRSAGARLGNFYQRERVLHRDKFWVRVS